MASTFGEGHSVDTNFCQWLVSISFHSNLVSNISIKNTGFKSYHVRLTCSVYVSVLNLELLHSFSAEGIELTEQASSGVVLDALLHGGKFRREFGFLRERWRFFLSNL